MLKNKRKQIKSSLTRFKTYFNQRKDSFDENTVEELRLRLDNVVGLLDKFNELQSNIELAEPSATDDSERESFEETYFYVVSQARSVCNKWKEKPMSSASQALGSVRSENSYSGSEGNLNNMPLIKLPTIKLPSFEGAHSDWLEFRDVLKALVDENISLSAIQKFYYLRTSLGKEPSQVIKSLDVSADNYKHAWRLLIERYENKSLMIHNHIKAIFDYPCILRESNRELRDLFDNVTKHLRSLESLGESTSMWDRLVIYILTSKFDKTTRRDWEAYKYKNELPNMEDMNMFLKERCEMLEKLETNKQDNSLKNKKVSSSLVTNAVSKLKCYVCEKDHTFYNCDVLLNMPVEKRIEKGHQHQPNRQLVLQRCKQRLGVSTTEGVGNGDARRELSATSTVLAVASHAEKPAATDGTENERPSVNSTRTVCEIGSVSEAAHVLLSTALVKIIVGGQTYTARALLDSGSQSSFVTEALCNRLQLEKLHIDHTVRGIGMGTINIKNRVNIKISSVYNKFELDVGCLVISKITDKLPRCTFKKSIIKIPEHLKLADPNFNVTGEVDILLGAQEFWKIVCVGQMSLGASMPFLQNTRLGRIIAGTFGIANQEESFSYLTVDAEESTNELVSKFWTLEEVKNDRVTSLGDQYCEKYFVDNFKRNSDGRIIVKIPFKEKLNELGQSRDIAIKRFTLWKDAYKKMKVYGRIT
nr:unnamed protein product [Callosobruchus analis]